MKHIVVVEKAKSARLVPFIVQEMRGIRRGKDKCWSCVVFSLYHSDAHTRTLPYDNIVSLTFQVHPRAVNPLKSQSLIQSRYCH